MSKKFLYLVLVCVVGAFVLASCLTQPVQLDGLIRAVQSAASDGVITPDELLVIQGQLPHSSGEAWMRVAEIGTAIVGSLLGVKIIPDRHLQSPFESAKPKES